MRNHIGKLKTKDVASLQWLIYYLSEVQYSQVVFAILFF